MILALNLIPYNTGLGTRVKAIVMLYIIEITAK